MFKGSSTLEAYERCMSVGLCDKHIIDFEKVSSSNERNELQRKAFLYIRLRILDPLLFGKKYLFEKMEALISKSDYFSSKSTNQGKNNFIDNILLLDSIVVFTLCQFCKICCCGCLFQSNQLVEPGLDEESAFIQKLLNSKNVSENDIRHFNPVLQENFIGYDKSLIKFCYVVALLFVRNTTIKVRLKQAINELTAELQKISRENKRWLEIAKEAGLKQNYEESLGAITSALNYNPYCYHTLAIRGIVYIRMKEFKKAQLDSYISTMINPQHFIAYGNLCIYLIHEKLFQDYLKLLQYAMKTCQFNKLKCQDIHELEKIIEIIEKRSLHENSSQFDDFEGMFMKLCNLELNFTKDCSNLMGEVKLELKNSLQNDLKNSSPGIEDVPDLEEAQDSDEDTEVPRLSDPDLSDDASKSNECNNENKHKVAKNKTPSTGKENSLSITKSTGSEAKKLETKSTEPVRRKLVRKSSVSEFKKFKTRSTEAVNIKLERKSSESESKKFETKSTEAVNIKLERKLSESDSKKLETKSSEVKKYETKELKSEVKESPILVKGDITKQLNELLKEGSEMLLDGCGHLAINQFISAMEMIDTSMKNYEACEIVCIKYACGLAYCTSGGYEDLQKSIEMFKQIIENHKNVTFPAAYYGIGLAFFKLNRFKDALKYLQTVSGILERGIRFKVYTWPGLKTVISETKSEQLKALISCKIKECEMPPSPDAVCRYEGCSTHPAIYYSDPDFKGFINLQCSDHCNLQYHAVCWKALKGLKDFTDKEFLEKTCLTPDCDGIIIKVEIIDKEGAVDKVFRSVQEKKALKLKKPKPPKRMDSKEEKRKKWQPRRDSESEKSNQADEIIPNSKENYQSEKEKTETSAIPLSVNAEPFIIMRKEKLSDEKVLKTPTKSKEIKKSRPVTISFKEFCKESDESGQDLSMVTYQQSENYSYVPKEWPSCSEVSSNFPPLNQETEVNNAAQIYPSDLDRDPLEIDDFDAIKNNLYNYLDEFLTRNGPLSVKNARLIRELETFPTEANIVIAKYGGIAEFLKNDIEYRFGIVDDLFICSRNDLADAYKLSRSSGVMGADNADLLEEYRVHSSSLSGSSSHIGPTLNPDAKEYHPSSIASSSTNSYTSLPEEIPSDSKTEKATRTPSSSLMSTISKLRQPLAVDDEGANNFLQDHFLNAGTKSASVQRQNIKTLAENCISAVKLYFSEDLNSQRIYIDSCIKPYTISNLLNKTSKALQTETIVIRTESKGTLKTDDEVDCLNKKVCQLTEEKRELEVYKTLIETKLTTEMDAAAKCNKKALVEIEFLKKELEDSNLTLQSFKTDYKSKEMKLEREHKVLMESLSKSAEENVQQEKEINIWCSKNQSLQEKLKKMEGRIEDLLNETNSLKKSLDQQLEKYNSSVRNAENEKKQLMKRAKFAEVKFLQFRKEVFLSKIDNKIKEAKSRMKDIEAFLPAFNPLYKKNMEMLLASINSYSKKLADTRLDLQTRCDEQINAVNNGALLESLTLVEAKELTEIPSFATQFPAGDLTVNDPMAMYNAAQMMFTGTQMNYSDSPFVAPQGTSPTNTTNLPPTNLNQTAKNLPPLHSYQVPPGIPDPGKEPSVATESDIFTPTASTAKAPLTSVANSGAIPKTSPAPSSSTSISNKSCDNLSLELGYKGKKDFEKSASSTSLSSQGTSAKGATSGKSCDKLLTKLKSKYPSYNEMQLMSFVKEFRKNRENGLSGLTIENIVGGVGALIHSQNQPKQPTRVPEFRSKVPQNKLIDMKTRKEKKEVPKPQQKAPSCPWGPSKSEEKNNWSGSGLDEGCIICYEEMTPTNAYKVDCGHCFHLKCIREWLNKKSDCPICRVHLLLPEDYPALK